MSLGFLGSGRAKTGGRIFLAADNIKSVQNGNLLGKNMSRKNITFRCSH